MIVCTTNRQHLIFNLVTSCLVVILAYAGKMKGSCKPLTTCSKDLDQKMEGYQILRNEYILPSYSTQE